MAQIPAQISNMQVEILARVGQNSEKLKNKYKVYYRISLNLRLNTGLTIA